MKYLRVACTRGYPPALYHLGARHLQGLGVDRSEAQAERLWRQAASLGNGDAMYRLGLLLLDRAQAVDVGLTTHSQAGDAIALNASTAEWTDGMALLEKAAKQGHVDAKFALGAMILGGLVNKSSDGTAEDVRQKRGVRLVREAAEEGVPGAQAAMARLLLEGRHGVSKDLVHAAYWVGQAANAGDAHSQLLYGCMYLDGFHYELKTAHKDARGNIRAQPGAILQARIS
jgi:TPR repeat protein